AVPHGATPRRKGIDLKGRAEQSHLPRMERGFHPGVHVPKAIPDGYHSLTPYIALRDAAKAIEFYKAALGATELYRMPMPGGKIAHAEIQIGNSRLMLSDEMPDWGNKSAQAYGGSPVALCIYTENVDALAERFVKAGGKQVRPLENHFYGDRSG